MTDWRAAAERCANTLLSVNADLLMFVEGLNYASDLTGVAKYPIQLTVPNRVVYEAHDYSWFHVRLPEDNLILSCLIPEIYREVIFHTNNINQRLTKDGAILL